MAAELRASAQEDSGWGARLQRLAWETQAWGRARDVVAEDSDIPPGFLTGTRGPSLTLCSSAEESAFRNEEPCAHARQ